MAEMQFTSNLLVKNISNDDDKMAQFFQQLAKQSFQQEQKFYKLLGISDEVDIPKSVEDTVVKLTNNVDFEKYQKILEKSVYGAKTSFIKYFYDEKFLTLVSGQAVGLEKVLNNLESDLADYQQIKSNNKEEETINMTDAEYNFDTSITFQYSKSGSKEIEQIKVDLKKNNIFSDLLNPKSKIKINSGSITKCIGKYIAQEKKIRPKVILTNEIINRITLFLQSQDMSSNTVKKTRRGFLLTADVRANNKEGGIYSALFGPSITNEQEFNEVIKGSGAIPRGGLAGTIFEGVLDIINETIEDSGEQSFTEDNANELYRALIVGMQSQGTIQVAPVIDGKVQKKLTETKGTKTVDVTISLKNWDNRLKELYENSKTDLPIEFKLLGDKSIFSTFFSDEFRNKLAKLLDKNGLLAQENEQTTKIICKIPIIREDRNLFYNKINSQTNNYNIQTYKKENLSSVAPEALTKDIKEMCTIFGSTISAVLGSLDSQAKVEFDTWWGTSENAQMSQYFEALLQKNPGSIYEILSKSTYQHVAGMIGETIFATILTSKMKKDSNEMVRVLGQESHGNKEAAVDLAYYSGTQGSILDSSNNNILDPQKLFKERAKSVGFQIKNYSSIGGSEKVTLYATTDKKLSDSTTMRRYITASAYEIIKNIFFTPNEDIRKIFYTSTGKNRMNMKAERDVELNKIGNILVEHIPYFMRYDEAQMDINNFGLEQNNFYIINFKFIPSSLLFYLMYEAIQEKALDAATKILADKYFYFSTYNESSNKTNIVSFLGSYDNFWKNKNNNIDSIEWITNKLAINFKGVEVYFKRNFDRLVKQIGSQ